MRDKSQFIKWIYHKILDVVNTLVTDFNLHIN